MEMESVSKVQILDCISLHANSLKKGMNPSVFLSTIGTLLGKLGSLALVRLPVFKKENSEYKPLLRKHSLYHILVMAEGLGIYINWTKKDI